MNTLNASTSQSICTVSSRAVVYGILAKAIGPDASYLSSKTFFNELSEGIKVLNDFNLKKELTVVRKSLSENNVNFDTLDIEYTRLFLKGICSPYETSYNVKRGIVKVHDLSDISGFYAAFGIKPHKELPDHIVSELEFMSLLCLKEVYALSHGKHTEVEICVDAQHKFVKEHLGWWLALFCKQVEKNARLSIYPALATLIHRFIIFDASYLNIDWTSETDGKKS